MKLAEVIDRMGVDVHDYLDREEIVPVCSGLSRQGDVIVVPTRPSKKPGQPVTPAGVPVVRGESGGNTHLLLADGPVVWAPVDNTGQVLGVVTVTDGGTGYLAHPEHGYLAFGPGAYEIRRQREMADEIRLVQD